MIGELPVFGLVFVLAGFVLTAVAGLAAMAKAFKTGLLWGVACLLVPGATLVFTLCFWRTAKGLFLAQLGGIILLVAGFALMFSDHDIHSGFVQAMNHRADLATAVADQEPDGVPPAPSLSQVLKSLGQPPTSTAGNTPAIAVAPTVAPTAQKQDSSPEARERKLRELYAHAQDWYLQLQQKRPAPGASPEAIRAFNEEYARYSALLEEYNKEKEAAAAAAPKVK